MQNRRSNLIIVPVGDEKTYHKQWLSQEKNFDIMLINYSGEQGKYRDDADYYYEAAGYKFEIAKKAILYYKEIVAAYAAIWMPDPDLAISVNDTNDLFDVFKRYKLDFAQASVKNSKCIYPIMYRRPYCIIRYINFIELMCPLFTRETLFAVLDTFDLNRSGLGIDWVWAKRLADKRLGVIDAVSVVHKKPLLSGEYYRKLNSENISIAKETGDIISRFGLPLPIKEYKRIWRRNGRFFEMMCRSVFLNRFLFFSENLYFRIKYYSLFRRLLRLS